jgi:hypothetical protein
MGFVIVGAIILMIFFPSVLSNIMNIGSAIIAGFFITLIVLLLLYWGFNEVFGLFK